VEIPLTQRNTTIKKNLYFLLSNGGGLTSRRLCITLPPGRPEGQGYDGSTFPYGIDDGIFDPLGRHRHHPEQSPGGIEYGACDYRSHRGNGGFP
jgi:hypothetical protein